MMMRPLLPLLLVVALQACMVSADEAECTADGSAAAPYTGVDVSYPIHSRHTKTDNPLGDKQEWYDNLINGCRESCDRCDSACVQTESDRIAMNRRQPQSMVNYTDFGIKKIRAPEALMVLLTEFWENNKGLEYPEQWGTGNTYVNHWEMPSYMLSVENRELQGGGTELKSMIWDAAVDSVREWTGQDLTTSSLYGIRVYKSGAVLAPHVDRLPLVSSCIINVAQDVDEPWPLEIYAHDGKAYNITMEPGDLVLYESHSVVHGRPFPLKGRYMANIFIHWEPVLSAEDFDSMPPYIIPGSPEAKKWELENRSSGEDMGPTEAHRVAATGDLRTLKSIAASKKRDMLFQPDQNGWQPIHEAARTNRVAVVEFLLEEGADADSRTNGGESPLRIAVNNKFGEDSEIAKVLRAAGSRLGPEEF